MKHLKDCFSAQHKVFKELGGIVEFLYILKKKKGYSTKGDHLSILELALSIVGIFSIPILLKGKKITLESFFGPYFDFKSRIPLIRGSKTQETANSYFYCNTEEIFRNAVNTVPIFETYYNKYPDSSDGFTYAFLEPPYGFAPNKTILEKGCFFLEFINTIFQDLDLLEIYEWNTDNITYFDTGREWWGTFLYSIYDPIKDIYIVILASGTD